MQTCRMCSFEELYEAGDYICYTDGNKPVAGVIILCPICSGWMATDDRWKVSIETGLTIRPAIVHVECGSKFTIKDGRVYAKGRLLCKSIGDVTREKGS